MTEPNTHAEFTELWRRTVSKLCHGKTQDNNTGKQMSATSPMRPDFHSPRHRGYGRYPGLNNGDSPGDVEPSQDIVWDSTSPTPSNTGPGHRNNRIVEISDIVNRIAPKDVKPKGPESPLLQWIGDSAIPFTPEMRKPRTRKKSTRQSNVEDLMKLARQFDQNMQQDKETSEQLNAVSSDLDEHVKTSETRAAPASFPSNAKDLKCSPSSDQVEAELHALFDCSTQGVSGRLSQSSAASPCLQDGKHQHVTSAASEQKESGSAARCPAGEKQSCGSSANNCADFDDDWENDDLLNDSLVLAMAQNPDQQHDADPKTTLQTNATQFTSVCKPAAQKNSTNQPSDCKPSCSSLQELCPKPKTTNRSSFKLEPNPCFQPKMAKEASKSGFTVKQTKTQMLEQKSASSKTPFTLQPDRITNNQKGALLGADSGKDISDSLWDDGDDDALLYQVCDSVERISNSQSQQASPRNRQETQDITVDGGRGSTKPLPTSSTNADTQKQSTCAFVRCNSLPTSSSGTVNLQAWNVPMKGANDKSRMSQSFPRSRTSLGTFGQCGDSSGTFQAGNVNVDMKTVTARTPQHLRPHHAAFKRNLSDSAAESSKVFVTSQMTGKCSAAEIERKKQEALARKRQRMQNASKP
ncbi:ewing's tumor-associated antigen 1 homolog [Acanthochromis polyacanthus]|uniref:ewing's tumor-associated antigen 1 homolog n=1 Tax=Acanthochromis polyacanthus TaxID=80966 RepID=UPI0022342257|nr:ewing's tumor-associated antigen 1 homolog [Acanthochromis polyacanthus]